MPAHKNKQKLLYLVHRIPYPPNKGDKIRSFNILKYLSSRYQVYLGTFIDDPHDWRYVDEVRAMCADCYFANLNPAYAKLRSMSGFVTGEPLTLPYYKDKGLQQWVDKAINGKEIANVLVFSSAMAQFVEKYIGLMGHSVIDFVDIDSDKWMQYAGSKSWPLSMVYRREGKSLLKYEKYIASKFNASLFVSESEADMFKQLAPESADRVRYVSNGVNTEYFTPYGDYPCPYRQDEKVLAFTGAMDYWANVDAVDWFSREVFPAIREYSPDVYFYIVGSRPTEHVRSLGNLPGINVTGAVHDIRPYISHAKLVVAPMRIARGIQNKVLEAMAMSKTVVVTPQGYAGIHAQHGKELIVESDNVRFADRVLDLLDSNELSAIGHAARKHVVEYYSWDKNLERIDTLIQV